MAFFLYAKVLDNILTVGAGSSYSREMCDPNRGPLHKATPETVDHLIVHSLFASAFFIYTCLGLLLHIPAAHWRTFLIMAIEGMEQEEEHVMGCDPWSNWCLDLGER